MHPRGSLFLPLLYVVLGFLAVVTTIVITTVERGPLPARFFPNANAVVCTNEAKICPEGSAVGRTSPSCEFAACPNANSNANVSLNVNASTNTNASDPTAGWKTYTNTVVGYSVKYPTNWVVKEVYLLNDPLFNVPVRFITIFNPNNKYLLTIGVRTNGSDTRLTDKTVVGNAGTLVNGKSVTIGDASVGTMMLVEDSKTKDILFFPSGSEYVEIRGFQVRAELRYGFMSESDFSTLNFDSLPETTTAIQILSTFRFTK